MANGSPRDPRIGTLLRDRWRIDARLGRGGVATVYSATHRNGNRVAIKMLNGEFSRHAEVKKRFLREGYAANAVNHPGVVRVLDDDVAEDGSAFLVMDLLEGEMLDERRVRKGGRLSAAEVVPIGTQLLDVLAAAHDKGILHRDIKPENIFIETDGTLKVLDFGVARMRAETHENTATGMLLGTPEFMSPEQANGIQGQIDSKTDLWAAGATLFTLLSGEPVHDCDTTAAQILATVTRPARSLSTVSKDVPRQIIVVVDRALAFEKHKRWADARAMKSALEAAARAAGITATSPEAKPAPGTPSKGGPQPPRPVPKAGPAAPRHKDLAPRSVRVPTEFGQGITGDEPTIVTNGELLGYDEPVASSGPTRQRPSPGYEDDATEPATQSTPAPMIRDGRDEPPVLSGSFLVPESQPHARAQPPSAFDNPMEEDVLTVAAPRTSSPVGGILIEAPTIRVRPSMPPPPVLVHIQSPYVQELRAGPRPSYPSQPQTPPPSQWQTAVILAVLGVVILWVAGTLAMGSLLSKPTPQQNPVVNPDAP